MLRMMQFDQAYHEHYYYWLVKPLSILFSKYGLSIVSISEHEIHGGTIRLVSSNKKEIVELYCKEGVDHCDDVQEYINIEESFDFSSILAFIYKQLQNYIELWFYSQDILIF